MIRKEAVNTKYKKTNIRIAPLKSCEPYRVSFENTQQPEGWGDFHIIYPATVRSHDEKYKYIGYKDENGGGGEANHQPIIDCMYDLLSKSQSQVCLNFSPPSLSLYLCCGLYFSYINPNAQVNED